MLTIPDYVKGLYWRDGVRKNFLVTFPNGDEGDIRNDRIVRESVKFTESCCSDNVFRFGGCERSMIEFETVGVDSLLGKIMDCWIEIDLSSLFPPQIAYIAANPGDGQYIAGDPDLYRIPLGRFLVTKCPRNHQAVTHRQVTGMTPTYWRLSPIERAKLEWYSGRNAPQIDPVAFTLANVGYYVPGFMESMGWSKSQALNWGDFSGPTSISVTDAYFETTGGAARYLSITGTYKSARSMLTSAKFPIGEKYAVGLGDLDLSGLRSFVDTWFTDVDWAATDMTYGFAQIRSKADFVRYILGANAKACPCLTHYDAGPAQMQVCALLSDAEVFDSQGILPDFAGRSFPQGYGSGSWLLTIPASVTFTITDENDAVLDTFSMALSEELPEVSKWSNSDQDSTNMRLTPAASDSYKYTYNSETYSYRSWLGSVDAGALIRGWMELNGKVLLAGRPAPKIAALSQAAPVEISVMDYQRGSVWWDDFQTDYIGTVAFTYGKNHDQAAELPIGIGESVYDISDNEVLKMTTYSADTIAGYLRDMLVPGINDLSIYSPAEISMPAWPWLEAGDALEITTEDGTIVETYIMTRTMTGVQLLFDQISAPGGDIEVSDDD